MDFIHIFIDAHFSDVVDLAVRYLPPKVSKRIQVKLLNYVVVEYCDFQYLPIKENDGCMQRIIVHLQKL